MSVCVIVLSKGTYCPFVLRCMAVSSTSRKCKIHLIILLLRLSVILTKLIMKKNDIMIKLNAYLMFLINCYWCGNFFG